MSKFDMVKPGPLPSLPKTTCSGIQSNTQLITKMSLNLSCTSENTCALSQGKIITKKRKIKKNIFINQVKEINKASNTTNKNNYAKDVNRVLPKRKLIRSSNTTLLLSSDVFNTSQKHINNLSYSTTRVLQTKSRSSSI